jgi:hypothetical protein
MKRIIFLCLMLLLTSGIKASDKAAVSFVVTGENTYYCDKVYIGAMSTRIYIDNRQVLKIPTSMIIAYSQNGRLFERLPVVNKKQDTVGWAFMQLISTRAGYRLYLFCSNCIHYDPATGEIAPFTPVYRYYIFKDGKFISVTDDLNVKSQLAKFGVKLVS